MSSLPGLYLKCKMKICRLLQPTWKVALSFDGWQDASQWAVMRSQTRGINIIMGLSQRWHTLQSGITARLDGSGGSFRCCRHRRVVKTTQRSSRTLLCCIGVSNEQLTTVGQTQRYNGADDPHYPFLGHEMSDSVKSNVPFSFAVRRITVYSGGHGSRWRWGDSLVEGEWTKHFWSSPSAWSCIFRSSSKHTTCNEYE